MKNIFFYTIVVCLLSLFQLDVFAKNYEIYDIHQHYVPADCYKQALLSQSYGLPTSVCNVEEQLKTMDKLGIKTAFISLASPHPYWGDKDETIKLVRQINDEGAKIVLQYPDRFKLFAALPLPDIEASIKEINYAYDKLHSAGIKLPTNAGGIYIGDERFDAIFNELNKRKAIVVLNPVQFQNLKKRLI